MIRYVAITEDKPADAKAPAKAAKPAASEISPTPPAGEGDAAFALESTLPFGKTPRPPKKRRGA